MDQAQQLAQLIQEVKDLQTLLYYCAIVFIYFLGFSRGYSG